MKSIYCIVFLLISMISLAHGLEDSGINIENKQDNNEILERSNQELKEIISKEREFAQIKWARLQKNNQSIKEEILDKLKILNTLQFENVLRLENSKIEKISALEENQITRLSNISAPNLRKIISLNQTRIKKLLQLNDEELLKISYLSILEIKKISDSEIEGIKNKLKKYRISKIESIQKRRIIPSSKLKAISQSIEEKKQDNNELKNNLNNIFSLIKNSQKEKQQEKIVSKSKEYLLSSIELLKNYLEILKFEIEQSEDITKEESESLAKELKSYIKKLDDLKSQTQDSNEKEEIKNKAKEISFEWSIIKTRVEFISIELINRQIEVLIEKSENVEIKLEQAITEIEEKNINSEDIQKKLIRLNNNTLTAKEKLKASKESLNNAKKTGIKTEIYKLTSNSKKNSKEAISILKQTHIILKDIIKELRILDIDINLEQQKDEKKLVEITEKEFIKTEIIGFIDKEKQELIDKLNSIITSQKTSAVITIEIKKDYDEYELKKEIKGKLTESETEILNKLTQEIEKSNQKIKIILSSGDYNEI